MRASSHAQQVQAAIQTRYWDAKRGLFALALDDSGSKVWPKRGDFMEDGTSQLFPILHGVIIRTHIAPSADRLPPLHRNISRLALTQQTGPVSVGLGRQVVALQMNDLSRARTYVSTVSERFARGFSYPWYCAESGWYVRVLLGLEAPQTVASL